jgi:ribosomal protein L23
MNAFEIIKTVRVTEKGTMQGEKFNQYTVVADRRANKIQIRRRWRSCSRSRCCG